MGIGVEAGLHTGERKNYDDYPLVKMKHSGTSAGEQLGLRTFAFTLLNIHVVTWES